MHYTCILQRFSFRIVLCTYTCTLMYLYQEVYCISSNRGLGLYFLRRSLSPASIRAGLKSGPGVYYFCLNEKRRGPLACVYSRTQFLTPPIVDMPSPTYLVYHLQEPRQGPTVPSTSLVHARLDYAKFTQINVL